MKDLIKRLVITIISGLLIGYLIFLIIGKTVIVQGYYLDYNTTYYIVLIVICLILFIFFGIYPVYVKMTKATLFVIGIALIIIGESVLLNKIPNEATNLTGEALILKQNLDTQANINGDSKGIYIGDIFKVLGVILTLLARTNVLITDKAKKKGKGKKVEIIEV